MGFLTFLLLKKSLNKNKAFIWNSKRKILTNIENINTVPLDLLIGIDRQKKTLLNNTLSFSKGNYTNNALLWGTRGNGKSTLIKSIFVSVSKTNQKLKLIQLNKNNIFDIEILYNVLSKLTKYQFIIFIDDLSFEKVDSDYKIIKSILDGSIQNQPKNLILYVTSNRRHLMPQEMIDNEKSSAIHTDENIEEKISLSDRFGLWIGFHNLSQIDYLKIVKSYFENYNIDYNSEIEVAAIKWSLQRGNRTGRTAWQFLTNIASEKNLKLNF